MWNGLKSRLWTFIPLVALFWLVVTISSMSAGLQPALSGVPTRATITAMTRCHNGDGTPDGTVKLTVAFHDARAGAHTYTETACYPYRFAVGRSLTVRYLAADPHRVATQNDLDRLAANVYLLVLSSCFAALCAGLLIVAAVTYLALTPLTDAAVGAARALAWGKVAGGVLIGLAAVGLVGCWVIAVNTHLAMDQNLASAARTGTASARVIGVTGCDYSNGGGGDIVLGALGRGTRGAGSSYPFARDNNNGEQPTISFVDRSGLIQQMELDECDPLYRVGMQVRVTYLLADPTVHYDDGPDSNTPSPGFDSFLFGAEGCFAGLMGLTILILLVKFGVVVLTNSFRPRQPRRRVARRRIA